MALCLNLFARMSKLISFTETKRNWRGLNISQLVSSNLFRTHTNTNWHQILPKICVYFYFDGVNNYVGGCQLDCVDLLTLPARNGKTSCSLSNTFVFCLLFEKNEK
jgi:hypothetical protein